MKRFLFFIFMLAFSLLGFEEKNPLIKDEAKRLEPLYTFELNNWKFKAGDDPNFAQLNFDDNNWAKVTIGSPLKKRLSTSGKNVPIVWYRKEFTINQNLPDL